MTKLKVLFGYLAIIAVIGGMGLLGYIAYQNQENSISFKGGDVPAIVGAVGDEVMLPEPTKEGYDFIGWFYDAELTNPCGESIIIQRGTTVIYPNWSIKHFQVSIKYINGGNIVSSDSVAYGQKVTLTNNIIPNVGYEIVWIESTSGERVVGNEVVITANSQFEQKEIPKTYTLNYSYVDNNTKQELSYAKDFVYNLNEESIYVQGDDVDVEGHTFSKWYYLDAQEEKVYISEGAYLTEAMIKLADASDNLTIYGEYTLNSYGLVIKVGDVEVRRDTLDYNASIMDVLNAIKASGELDKPHYTLEGWGIYGEDGETDFTNAKMPAEELTITPIYQIVTYNITFVSHFMKNIVNVKTVPVDYSNMLFEEDLPTLAEQETAVANCENWRGQSTISEYNFAYCYLVSDDSVHYNSLNDILIKLNFVEQDETVICVYRKTIFYIEYYKSFNFETNEYSDFYKRVEIEGEGEFTVEPSISHEDSNNYEFGGWAFADNTAKFLDYDSFDDVNIGEDVAVFADFYRRDPQKWVTTTGESLTGESALYATRYTGSYYSVVVPISLGEYVYGIGGKGAIINEGNNGGRRFLINDTVGNICEDAFLNMDVVLRFKSTQLSLEKSLTIQENAFRSAPVTETYWDEVKQETKLNTNERIAEYNKSIKYIKLPDWTTKVAEGAFAGAINLKEIAVAERCTKYYTEDGVLYERIVGTSNVNLLAYPLAKEEDSFEIGANVQRVAKRAFATAYAEAFANKENITGGFGVEDIEKAPKLRNLTIAESNNLKEIGDRAFYGNAQMFSINLSSLPKLENIGEYVFHACFAQSRTSGAERGNNFTFDLNNLTYIPDGFLKYSRALGILNIKNMDNINRIGSEAFSELGAFSNTPNSTRESLSLVLNSHINYIGSSAFYSSYIDLKLTPTFDLVASSDGEKAVVMSSAFGYGRSTQLRRTQISGVEGRTSLVINGVNLASNAFGGAIFNMDVKLVDCNVNYSASSSSSFGSIFSEGQVRGSLEVVFTNEASGKVIYGGMFYSCYTTGTITVDFKHNKGEIRNYAFNRTQCQQLIIKGVSTVANRIFASSYTEVGGVLTDVLFDNSCSFTSIGDYFLDDCTALKTITFPASLTTVTVNSFTNWLKDFDPTVVSSLESIIFNNPTSVVQVANDGILLLNDKVQIKVPSSIRSDYENTISWKGLYTAGRIVAI